MFLMCLIYSQVTSPTGHTLPYLVSVTGLEPVLIKERDFKSLVSAYSTTPTYW